MAKEVTIKITATDSFSSVISQYQTAIKGAASDTNALQAASSSSKSAIDSMGTALTGMIAAYAGMKGIQLVGDMINLGTEANTTETVFRQLVSTMGDYETVLQRIRTATGGIVDDKTLQEGSNKFLQMGIAKNPEELTRLMEMAIKLGGSMGMSPEKSISDFSLMIANNSVMRLDQFGISAGAVRERMAELKETVEGIDRSDAFQLAVLEIGAASLDKLGDAANAAATPLARLTTAMQNTAQNFAQNFTTGLNSLLGIAEIMSGNNPIQQQVQSAAAANATAYLDTFKNALSGTDMAGYGSIVGDQGLQNMLTDAFTRVGYNPGADMAELFGNPDSRDTLTQAIVSTITQAQEAAAVQLQQQGGGATADLMNAAMRAGAPGADIQNITALGFEPTQAFLNAQREIRNAHGELAQFMGTYSDLTNMPSLAQFMRPEDANTITGLFEAAQTDLEHLRDLHDQDLISDNQLQQAEDMTTKLSAMSDQAQAAADAFENLSLSQALGQGSGGIGGEVTDMLTKYMKDNGFDEAQITAMTQGVGLKTGRETQSSLMLQNMLIPLLAGLSPEQAGGQIINIQDFLQNATLQGMSQNRIAGLLPSMAEKGFDYYNYDPLSSIGGGGKGKGGGDMSEAVNNTEQIAGNLSTAAGEAQAIADAVNAIPDAKNIRITITADDPQGILALAGQSIGVQVRDNGGTVPGTKGGSGSSGGSKPSTGIGRNKPF